MKECIETVRTMVRGHDDVHHDSKSLYSHYVKVMNDFLKPFTAVDWDDDRKLEKALNDIMTKHYNEIRDSVLNIVTLLGMLEKEIAPKERRMSQADARAAAESIQAVRKLLCEQNPLTIYDSEDMPLEEGIKAEFAKICKACAKEEE